MVNDNMFMNYQYWQDNETEKIHKDYDNKRDEIKSEAFLAGFAGLNRKDATTQDINTRYNATYQQEESTVKAIQAQAEQWDTERTKQIEEERKEQVRRAWK